MQVRHIISRRASCVLGTQETLSNCLGTEADEEMDTIWSVLGDQTFMICYLTYFLPTSAGLFRQYHHFGDLGVFISSLSSAISAVSYSACFRIENLGRCPGWSWWIARCLLFDKWHPTYHISHVFWLKLGKGSLVREGCAACSRISMPERTPGLWEGRNWRWNQ